ncbi:MAG TPA: single-stranded-DNA-specific exonuclease RecJ, partial [Coleofasciculaceae cyanobacterium]
APKLLIENCWFENAWNSNTQDLKGRKVQYIKTEFEIWDESCSDGFPGLWWGHYKDELPKGRCSCIVELDYNNYKKRTEVRLVAVQANSEAFAVNNSAPLDWILDWRGEDGEINFTSQPTIDNSQSNHPLTLRDCPMSWDELQLWIRRAIQADRKLAIAYPPPLEQSSTEIWKQLVGIAKFLSRTGQSATLEQLRDKLNLSDRTLHLGLNALAHLGFQVKHQAWSVTINWHSSELSLNGTSSATHEDILIFLTAVEEEQFLRQYFYQVPLSTIQAQAIPASR